jgi:ATP:ADP antiporter, AAA family
MSEPMGREPRLEEEGSRWRAFVSRLGIDFRGGELAPALLLFLVFFLLITFQYTTKSVRQSTFINSLGAEKLPYVYLFIALASYPVLRLYSRLADRMRRHDLIAATCFFTALTMAGFWWLYQFSWPWVAFAFYVWISITVVLLVSQFWSFSNNMLDPRQAKRLFGFIGAGGLLGGIAGGQVARFATAAVGTRYALLVASVLLFIVTAVIFLIHRFHPVEEKRVGGAAGLAKLDVARGGFELLRKSKHLRGVALIMLLTVVVAQIVDLQFNWAVQRATTTLDQRTAFFGNFYSVIGIMAFAFQLFFTARIHRTVGVGVGMRVLPFTMAIGTIALLVAGAALPELLLAAALVLKVGENGVRYSLDQATRELLFLPIPSRARLKAKAFIDVFVQRGAKGVAALLLLPVTFNILTPVDVGWLSLVLIGGWLVATLSVKRHYVESFREGLKKQAGGESAALDLSDATALELVMQSLGSREPRQVLHALRLLASHGRYKLVPSLLLYHEDGLVRRATLRLLAEGKRLDAIPLVERALSDDDAGVRVEAVSVLALLRERDACSLMLPYLGAADPGLTAAAVTCLTNHGSDEMKERARLALGTLMASESSAGRAEAAKAIAQIDEPQYRHELLLLLGDREPDVVLEAVAAVRHRVLRCGANPFYLPSLVAQLNERKLKHEVRRALVAHGEAAIPPLIHFMNSDEERPWVRRALPKTIGMIGGEAAATALAESIVVARDPFLLQKLIEALCALRADDPGLTIDPALIQSAVTMEGERHFRSLAALLSLGWARGGNGTLVVGGVSRYGPDDLPALLEQLLNGRAAQTLRNVFGLLELQYERQHVRDAWRSLASGDAALRGHALEYLDNLLSPALRRIVMPMIDDHPLSVRMEAARKLFGITLDSRDDTLVRLVESSLDGDSESAGLAAAALYEIYTGRETRLYPRITAFESDERTDSFVRETAGWVTARIASTHRTLRIE